jgi:hypothetical protein
MEADGSLKPEVIKFGESKTFYITPLPGYEITDVEVDGVSVGPVSSYTFQDVAENHTITASFKKKEPPVLTEEKKINSAS